MTIDFVLKYRLCTKLASIKAVFCFHLSTYVLPYTLNGTVSPGSNEVEMLFFFSVKTLHGKKFLDQTKSKLFPLVNFRQNIFPYSQNIDSLS